MARKLAVISLMPIIDDIVAIHQFLKKQPRQILTGLGKMEEKQVYNTNHQLVVSPPYQTLTL